MLKVPAGSFLLAPRPNSAKRFCSWKGMVTPVTEKTFSFLSSERLQFLETVALEVSS
jgi:hypothetical protein